uniref:Uncharacterized protein n=1 Tax=Oryza sativa subsp. japonica TaxID=39947 RepID=Q2R1W8_ORYSJ|nr:hypothetical protein LOC_Os11g37810 [Oryza sativa Japonica Group]
MDGEDDDGWRGGEAEGDLAAAMPEVETATSAGALARRKGLPEWVPTRPRERRRGRRRSGEIRATPWLGRGREWRSGAGRGGGDAGRRLGKETEAAGGGTVAATPLYTSEDASPMVPVRNGGQAGVEGTPARPRKVVVTSATARARRHRRLEGGRRHGRERRTAGRGGEATGERGRGLKR